MDFQGASKSVTTLNCCPER